MCMIIERPGSVGQLLSLANQSRMCCSNTGGVTLGAVKLESWYETILLLLAISDPRVTH